jgi:hypothetical protein
LWVLGVGEFGQTTQWAESERRGRRLEEKRKRAMKEGKGKN